MCGLAGMIWRDDRSEDDVRRRGAAALQAMAYRGPDGEGTYLHRNVWLGHKRLSILDLSDAGRQPMVSADGRHVIAYNGETYNFRELAAREALHDLGSGSDTEVVLRLLARRGADALIDFNGMFALALYDQHTRRVTLARDRLGIKPLYIGRAADCIVFGSEIKALLALEPLTRQCNDGALHEWLYFGNLGGEQTLFDSIEVVPPGSAVEIDVDSLEVRQRTWWQLPRDQKTVPSAADPVAATRAALASAVRRQLVSDVPVGVFLSGGIDSSALVAFGAPHYEGRLSTWTAEFDFGSDPAELARARRVSEHFGTDHHQLQIRGDDIADTVVRLVHHHDHPFSDPANIPLYLLASEVGKHCRVVLQGDGGDELFGGYSRYFWLRYWSLLRWPAKALRPVLALAPRSGAIVRADRMAAALGAPGFGRAIARLHTMELPERHPERVFGPALQERLLASDPLARVAALQREYAAFDPANQVSMVDLRFVLPSRFLEKVDKSTMAASVEVRVPFLDHELVDTVVDWPGQLKMPRGRRKWLLKRALRGVVPDDVLDAPKSGLSVPFRQWLAGPLRPLFLDTLTAFGRDHPGTLATSLGSPDAWTGDAPPVPAPMMWKLLNFMLWAREMRPTF